MDTIVASSSAQFTSTTGFSLSDLVTWMGTTLLKPIMGTGLATLSALIYWIVALVAIGIVVYLSYRAFRFFRH